ncbi:GNAT family N-acetyltransferase [Rheinheimera texasensis]|uniref:GNAT family N-acetyltransferase n=1 Tax=Rheinheimera texasensis TaxID=306205 RepID=UPI0004E1C31B|nr:N-acetyltransferase [Rheinheimera texasensis]
MAELSGELSFGPVLKQELAAVAALEEAAFPPPVYPVFFFRQAYDLWPQLFWVARRGDEILAYLICGPELSNRQRLSLMSFAVDPKTQGQGIGKALLQAFMQQLPEIAPDVSQLWLTADPDNAAALRLYQQHGFVQTAEEPDYYGSGYRRLVLTAQTGGKNC